MQQLDYKKKLTPLKTSDGILIIEMPSLDHLIIRKNKMHFKTVQDYYLYYSQGNTFAPPFDELIYKAKQKWIEDFNEYKSSKLNK